MPETKQGPNFKELVIRVMARDAVPEGGGFADAAAFLSSKERILLSAHVAWKWVSLAIQAVRSAPGQNRWKDADDEAIAGEILKQVRENEARNRGGSGA